MLHRVLRDLTEMASEILTDNQITTLMQLPKQVENPNARARDEGKHTRRDFRVVSSDGTHEFTLFTRQSRLLPHSFSAGLLWLAKSGESVILLRCNGADHPHTNNIERDRFEFTCHIHQATERYLAAGKKVRDMPRQPRHTEHSKARCTMLYSNARLQV